MWVIWFERRRPGRNARWTGHHGYVGSADRDCWLRHGRADPPGPTPGGRSGSAIVGCADPELSAAAALADRASLRSETGTERPVPSFADYRELLRTQVPDALAIFTPHLSHYRVTMDALQAGCHVFIEKPLSTNVQEAADIVSLAKGRNLKVGVGHQFRLCPSLIEARRRIALGAIGPVRLVTCLLARPWLTTLGRQESTWRFNPKIGGRRHPLRRRRSLDRRFALDDRTDRAEVGAVQSDWVPGIDLVTAAAIRLADGTPVSLADFGNIARGALRA